MFYETATNAHGLPHDPFKAIVTPRPIGWITAMSAKGEVNLSPYSFFNAVSERPPMVAFSSAGKKDALTFIEETGEFVCNLATYDLREKMNATSAVLPRGVNEMEHAGLTPAPSRLVKPPRVADARRAGAGARGCRRARGPYRRSRRFRGPRASRAPRGLGSPAAPTRSPCARRRRPGASAR